MRLAWKGTLTQAVVADTLRVVVLQGGKGAPCIDGSGCDMLPDNAGVSGASPPLACSPQGISSGCAAAPAHQAGPSCAVTFVPRRKLPWADKQTQTSSRPGTAAAAGNLRGPPWRC